MTLNEVASMRLSCQQIGGTKFKTPKDLASWMGGLQAQDFAMAIWAIGSRLAGSSNRSIQTAIDKGSLLRTHVLRPTWHFVSSEDIGWMLALTGPKILATLKTREKSLELSAHLFTKSETLFQKALNGKSSLTREELISILNKNKIETDHNRGSHLLVHAELTGLICSGQSKGNKQTYALLSERVRRSKHLSREASLEKLADKYFSSHGPATVSDFIWWSGLSPKDARHAIEIIQNRFHSESIGKDLYWFGQTSDMASLSQQKLFLLPAYDEYIISYKSRVASLQAVHNTRAISSNGIFRPVIVLNGQVIGLWRRTTKNQTLIIETELFQKIKPALKDQLEEAVKQFGQFFDLETMHQSKSV